MHCIEMVDADDANHSVCHDDDVWVVAEVQPYEVAVPVARACTGRSMHIPVVVVVL